MTQKKTKILAVTVLTALGPPSSPPTAGCLRAIRMTMAKRASTQKIVTENPKLNNNMYVLSKACWISVI